MKRIFTTCFLGTALFAANAQVFPYDFSILNQPYADLQNPILLTTESWDDPSLTVPLGFEFNFLGSTTNNLYFDLGLGGLLVPDFVGSAVDMILAYNSDIIDAGFNSNEMLSPISYLVEGIPGSRICKIEWKEAAFFNEVTEFETALNRVNFQLWLYEGSNVIEVRFGENTIKAFDLVHDGMGPMIGFIEGLDLINENFTALYALQGAPASATVSTWTDMPEVLSFLTDDPSNGTVYRFAPNGVVNVDEPEVAANFVLFPQPAQDYCTLMFSEPVDFLTVQLFDMSGREVSTYAGNSSSVVLNLSELSQGVYIARVTANGREFTRKLVRN